MTLSALLSSVKTAETFLELQDSTKRSYSLAVSTWIQLMGDSEVSSIDLPTIDKFKASAKTTKVKRSKDESVLTPSTINIYLRSLKALIGKAVDLKLVDANPFTESKLVKVPAKAPAFVTPEEQEKLLEKVSNPRLKRLFIFLFNTGLRSGEALSLKIENVNLANRTASIVCDSDFTTKTGRSRAVPLNDKALEALTAQIGKRTSGKVWDYTLSYASHAFKKSALAAGMGHLHLYNTRHSAASNLLMKGASIASVASLLGHTSINVVMNHYAHLTAAHLQSTVNLLN